MATTNFLTLRDLSELNNLEFIARQVVEGFIVGLHKSPFHGFSVEFAEHRLYNQGDPLKSIDWKVFGRTDRLYVKKFEEETNLRCQLVIDASSSMYYPEDFAEAKLPVNKMRFSIASAASLMYLLKKQRDAVGLSIFSDEIDVHTKARSSNVHHTLLNSYLENLWTTPSKNKKTSAAKSLHQIAENIHNRSLVAIFSDMMDSDENTNEIFSALQHLKHNKHEVILFHVTDKRREEDFEFENRPYIFIDVESGDKVRLQPNQVKEHYVEQMTKYKKDLKLKCAQYKIDFVEADINRDFKQVLLPYLVKRAKMK